MLLESNHLEFIFFGFDRKYGSRHLKLAGFKNVEKLKKVFLE